MDYTYDKYNGVKVTCCGKEMTQVWHSGDKPNDGVTYDCEVCGKSISSDKHYAFEKRARETELNKEVQDTVKAVSGLINSYSDKGKKFAELMGREHKTLQQAFTGICMDWLRYLADLNDNQYDARNEASVKLAKEIMEKVEGANYRLPMI